jgi:hypothetical protein
MMAAISGNYPAPVQVNGFSCKNCTDIGYAKKHIDPAHPKSGPYGIDAASDPSQTNKPSVRFGGALSGVSPPAAPAAEAADAPGAQLDVTV